MPIACPDDPKPYGYFLKEFVKVALRTTPPEKLSALIKICRQNFADKPKGPKGL
jgi:hypothetical protein